MGSLHFSVTVFTGMNVDGMLSWDILARIWEAEERHPARHTPWKMEHGTEFSPRAARKHTHLSPGTLHSCQLGRRSFL